MLNWEKINREWQEHGQRKVDWIMNALYRIMHPYKIFEARKVIELIARDCRVMATANPENKIITFRNHLARVSNWTRDPLIDWKREPDVLIASQYKSDCEDKARWARFIAGQLGWQAREHSLWVTQIESLSLPSGHAICVIYDENGKAILVTSNANCYRRDAYIGTSVRDVVCQFAQSYTGAVYSYVIPEIQEHLPPLQVETMTQS